ncbi:MAG: hypothetical protein ACI83B_003288 [Sediminicola sp.]|jgi:hypothetical protein
MSASDVTHVQITPSALSVPLESTQPFVNPLNPNKSVPLPIPVAQPVDDFKAVPTLPA